jgi:hypothetical protein
MGLNVYLENQLYFVFEVRILNFLWVNRTRQWDKGQGTKKPTVKLPKPG